MKAIATAFMITSAILSVARGEDLEASIVAYAHELPYGLQGAAIVAQLRNVSGHPVTVEQLLGEVRIRDIQGQRIADCPPTDTNGHSTFFVIYPPNAQTIPVAWNWTATKGGICIRPSVSEIVVQFVVTSSGKQLKTPEGQPIWRGEARSKEVHISFVEPTGIDKEAYEALGGSPTGHPGTLLRDYPTSTYAAYVIYDSECAQGRTHADPALRMQSIIWYKDSGRRRSASLPDSKKGGWGTLWGRDIGQSCNKWISDVLDAQSGIWFADELRLSRAVNFVWLAEYGKAAKEFGDLAATEQPGVIQERAKEYLSLMLADGMIKPEAIPAELRAKLPKVEAPARKPVAKD